MIWECFCHSFDPKSHQNASRCKYITLSYLLYTNVRNNYDKTVLNELNNYLLDFYLRFGRWNQPSHCGKVRHYLLETVAYHGVRQVCLFIVLLWLGRDNLTLLYSRPTINKKKLWRLFDTLVDSRMGPFSFGKDFQRTIRLSFNFSYGSRIGLPFLVGLGLMKNWWPTKKESWTFHFPLTAVSWQLFRATELLSFGKSNRIAR